MSERSRSSSFHGSHISVDTHGFEYHITRNEENGELEWVPKKGTRELSDALTVQFPRLDTTRDRMQVAIIKFLKWERKQKATSFDSQPTTTPQTQQQFSDGRTNHHSNMAVGPSFTSRSQPTARLPSFNAPDPISHSSQSQPANQSNEPNSPPRVSSLKSEREGRRRKRQFTDAEREEIRLNRVPNTICDDHRLKRTKCDPKSCKNNKLYNKIQHGGESETSSLNQPPSSAGSPASSLNHSRLVPNKVVEPDMIKLSSRIRTAALAQPVVAQTQTSEGPYLQPQAPCIANLSVEIPASSPLEWNQTQNNCFLDDQYMFSGPEGDMFMTRSDGQMDPNFLPWPPLQASLVQELGNSSYVNTEPSIPTSQDLIHQHSTAQDHYFEMADSDDETSAPKSSDRRVDDAARGLESLSLGKDKMSKPRKRVSKYMMKWLHSDAQCVVQ